MRVLPVNEAEIFLQVSCVDMALAELQLSARVVVNVVNTHFLHDAKTSLRRERDLEGDGEEDKDVVRKADEGIKGGRDGKDHKNEGNMVSLKEKDEGKRKIREGILKVILLSLLKVNFGNMKITLYIDSVTLTTVGLLLSSVL